MDLDNLEEIQFENRKEIIKAFVKNDLRTSFYSKLSLLETIFKIILCTLSWIVGHQFLLKFSLDENNGFDIFNYNFWWFSMIPIFFTAILIIIFLLWLCKKRISNKNRIRDCERESYLCLIFYNSLYFIWFTFLFIFLNNNPNIAKYQTIIYYIPIILTSNYSMIPGNNSIFMNSQYEIFIDLTDFVNIYLLLSSSKIFDYD